MKYVYFKITKPGKDLTNAGVITGMEYTGKLMHTGAVCFSVFKDHWRHCVAYPNEYNILVNHDLQRDYDDYFKDIPVHDVESLFNPDDETPVFVIKLSDLNKHQREFLNIAEVYQ
ncbi:MAG: hypothetical protein K0B15_11855 [Lentimicrobium sp.]|nr:hypothetical protein [Lentimicrobium sp.]